jgi:hypothetical protein
MTLRSWVDNRALTPCYSMFDMLCLMVILLRATGLQLVAWCLKKNYTAFKFNTYARFGKLVMMLALPAVYSQ